MPGRDGWSRRGMLVAAGAVGLCPARVLADIPRYKTIRARVLPSLQRGFADAGMTYPAARLLLRVLKHERELQVWVADDPERDLQLFERFEICAASGDIGPKRRQGDEQVPEGLYQIHRYNAWSGFHMSLRVNYPNASDLARGNRFNPGGAIMVHGGCASIGCMALGDEAIERVFVTTLDASRAGRRQPSILILPTTFDDAGWRRLETAAAGDPELMTLWTELAAIDGAFVETRQIPEVDIDPRTGAYALRL